MELNREELEKKISENTKLLEELNEETYQLSYKLEKEYHIEDYKKEFSNTYWKLIDSSQDYTEYIKVLNVLFDENCHWVFIEYIYISTHIDNLNINVTNCSIESFKNKPKQKITKEEFTEFYNNNLDIVNKILEG